MKRIICTMLLLVLTLCMAGCNNKKYKLTLEGADGNLVYPLQESYRAGEKVEVVTEICFDVDLVIYLNDEPIEKTYSDRPYWKYEFIMPNKDSVLRFSIEGGLPYDYGTYNEYYFRYIPGEDQVETTETIDGVKFNYNDSGKIYGCKNDEQLTLQECFDRGIITHANLVEINEEHKIDFPFMYEDENTYTLNEVLGYDKSEITKVQYAAFSLDPTSDAPGIMINAGVRNTINTLDVNYVLDSTTNYISFSDFITTFYLHKNDECAVVRWLKNKTVCIERPEGNYYSKEPVELISGITIPNLTFSYTSFAKGENPNNNQIIDILDTLYWNKAFNSENKEYLSINIDKYDHYISTTRTLEKGIEGTMFCVAGEDYLITYSIDFETGYVFMTPADVSSLVHDLYSILSLTQINLIKSLINDDEYTLDEVLGIDENQIENISCFYLRNLWDSVAYPMELDIKETMEALDVKYYKVDAIGMDALNNKPVFSIKISNKFIPINWENDNRVYFEINGKYYFSKEKINLYEYITNTRLYSLIIINPIAYSNIMIGYEEKYQVELSSYNTYIMGLYNNAVIMLIEGDAQAEKTISILDYNFTYKCDFNLLVYKDNKFYSLSSQEDLEDLLNSKILIEEDIESLFNRFNNNYNN